MKLSKKKICAALILSISLLLVLFYACQFEAELRNGEYRVGTVKAKIDGKGFSLKFTDNIQRKVTITFYNEEFEKISEESHLCVKQIKTDIPDDAKHLVLAFERVRKNGKHEDFEVMTANLPDQRRRDDCSLRSGASRGHLPNTFTPVTARYLVEGSMEEVLDDTLAQILTFADSPGDVPDSVTILEHIRLNGVPPTENRLLSQGIFIEMTVTVSHPDDLLAFAVEQEGNRLFTSAPEDIVLLEGGAQGFAAFHAPLWWSGKKSFSLTIENSLGECRELSLALTF